MVLPVDPGGRVVVPVVAVVVVGVAPGGAIGGGAVVDAVVPTAAVVSVANTESSVIGVVVSPVAGSTWMTVNSVGVLVVAAVAAAVDGIVIVGSTTRSRTWATAPHESATAVNAANAHPATNLIQLGISPLSQLQDYVFVREWLGVG